MDDPAAVAAAANRAGLFALMAQLAAAGVLPRERAGQVLDVMFDTVLQSSLSHEARGALIDAMQSDWTEVGARR